jgi:nucleoside permease NupC
VLGHELVGFARQSFLSGMDLAVTVAAVVVGVVALVVLIVLPNRAAQQQDGTGGSASKVGVRTG